MQLGIKESKMSKQYCVINQWELNNGETWLYTLVGVTNNWYEAIGMAEADFDDSLEQDKKDAGPDLEIIHEAHFYYDAEDGSWRWSARTRRKNGKSDFLVVSILTKEGKENVCNP